MSGSNPTVSEWFQTEWDDQVLSMYQEEGGRVINTVRKKRVDNAKELIFRTIGTIEFDKIEGEGDRKETGAKRQKTTLTPEPYGALFTVKEDDLDKMEPDDRDAMHREASKGASRKSDEITIKAMNEGANDQGHGGAGEFISPIMVDEFWETMEAKGIYRGEEEIYCLISAKMQTQLRRFKEFSSSEYTGPDMPYITRRGMRTWNDINWIAVGSLPKTGNLRKGFFYTMESVAHGALKDLRTLWDWENRKDQWSCNMKMVQNAAVIKENGCFSFEVDESLNPRGIDPDTVSYTAP